MKTFRLLLIMFIFGSLTACKVGVVSTSGGKDSQSYLQFVQGGNQSYKNGVAVYVDNNPVFTAKVDKVKKNSIKGNRYVINPGTRHIKVVDNGKTLYEKNVIVSSQETKKIILP